VSTARNDRDYDEKALLAFIRKSFPNEPDVVIEKSGFISGGFSKFTIGLTLGKVKSLPQEIVLRGDASATFGGASVVDEFGVIKALYDNGVKVAKPLALEATGSVFGSPFLLAERKPGTILGHTFNLPKPNKAICIDVATQLAKAHQVPLSALGPKFGSAHPTSSAKALSWVDEGYNNWLPLNTPSPVFKTAFEWLRRNAGISDKVPRALTHGDYSLANVLVHEDKVSAILDWEFAHIGNPIYDLCYHRYQAEALSSWEDFLDAYVKAGMPRPSEEQLNYNTLLADVRLGVMVCQVKNVFTSGAEPNTATASVLAQLSYEITIDRIARTLDKVL
jgi:aminoglycoside phosphotransferase (APT) family kinase protein